MSRGPRCRNRFRWESLYALFFVVAATWPSSASAQSVSGPEKPTTQPALSPEDVDSLKTLLMAGRTAYVREDFSGYMATWHPGSPYYTPREKTMRDLFERFDKLELVSFEFRDFSTDGEEARVRVRSEERAVNATDGATARGFGVRNRIYVCRRDERRAWKIWHQYPAEVDLMNALCATKTAAGRAALLDASPELVVTDLLSNLSQQGTREVIAARYEEMLLSWTVFCEVAARYKLRAYETSGLYQVGSAYKFLNRFVPAMNAFQKSLDIAEQEGDARGLQTALSALGNLHISLGNLTLATDYLERAERIDTPADKVLVWETLGRVHSLRNDPAGAIKYFDLAMAQLRKREPKPTTTATIANVHVNRATAKMGAGDRQGALQDAQTALTLNETINNRRGIPQTLRTLAEIHRSLGNDVEALRLLDRADPLAKAIGQTNVLQNSFLTRAAILRGRKDRAGERAALTAAVAVIEEERGSVIGSESTQQNFLRDKGHPYQLLARMAIEERRPDQALAWTERGRGRVLLDVLTGGRAEINGVLTESERAKEDALRRELKTVSAVLRAEVQSSEPNAAAITQQTLRLASARAAVESYNTVLYAAHPDLKTQRGEATPITPAEAVRLLPNDKSALLEYAVSENGVFLLVLTDGKTGPDLRAYPFAMTRDQLAAQTNTFRDRIASRDPGFGPEAKALYERLIAPAAKQLAGKTNLIVTPDGPLWDLPFQALQTPAGRFLLQDRTVSYAPSWTTLREIVALRHKRQPAGTMNLLAIGNPALSANQVADEALVYRGASPAMTRLVALPAAEAEVKAVAGFYPRTRRRIYVGQEARESRVKGEASGARILHFATHGVLDDRDPLYSHIVLAQNEGADSREDGLLEARELLRMPLRADLAVLSACETARGQFRTGEGVIGLTWSLFIAGCPRAVVSQWRVDSAGTTDLMVAFHRNLTGNAGAAGKKSTPLPPAEALRQASLGLLKTEKWRHPFYWAPFVLIGDGD